jgi:uncharacterized OsmC-like protein
MEKVSVISLQAPLRKKYVASPDTAWVTDHAQTSSTERQDPFHATVEPMTGCGVKVPVGVHAAVGGPHDAPTPGDILCAALAACQDSSIRMVANILGVELESLQVSVTAGVDVRGALAMNRDVPVGFQQMNCTVEIRVKKGTDAALLERLSVSAEQSCVVLQTLRSPPPVNVQFSLS